MSALLLFSACNPAVFDDFVGEQVSPDAGDAATARDAQLDAHPSEMDARAVDAAPDTSVVELFDSSVTDSSVVDSSVVDSSVVDSSVVDASDAGVDAGPACFAAGSSLISYFPLDGAGADAVNRASVIELSTTYEDGRVGKALQGGELALAQARLDAPRALTIAAWLRLDSVPDGLNAAWLWKGDLSGSDYTAGYWLVIAGPQFHPENAKYLVGTPGQGHLGFALTDGTDEQFLLTDRPFPVQQYTHVVATFDGTRARLYLDGAIVHDEAQLVQARATTNPVRVASPLGGAVAPLWGQVDELAFFDRALTPSEVSALFQQNGVVCAK